MDKTRTRTNIVQLSDKRKVEIVEKLKLDESMKPRTRTRSAMAIDLAGGEAEKEEDVFNFAPIPKRAVAFVLDVLFILCSAIIVRAVVPLERQLVQLFMDKYQLKFLVPELTVMKTLLGISGVLALFFCMVIPLAFFNVSFGKKFLGLRVRGHTTYTVSISQALKREILFKPLSILTVLGMIMPFMSKRRYALHDQLCKTVVIEE